MINIDYRKDKLLTEFSLKTLEDRYLVGDEKSPQEGFARAAQAFADDDAHAQRLYDYASNLWFMFATPVLSNGGTQRGLPISCFLNYVDDSREGITGHYTENAYLSSFGGGIGGSWSDVRAQGTRTSKGSESTGVMPFVKVVDSEMLAFSQGVTRRGSYAAYLHMSHPEVEEFLDMRKPTGGDTNRKCLNLHHGVVIPDKFMEIIHKATKEPGFDDSWELIDPHSGEERGMQILDRNRVFHRHQGTFVRGLSIDESWLHTASPHHNTSPSGKVPVQAVMLHFLQFVGSCPGLIPRSRSRYSLDHHVPAEFAGQDHQGPVEQSAFFQI